MKTDRRTFLRQSGAAGIIPLVGAAPPPEQEYFVKGLTAMARACDRPGWFQAHWGAAVLASSYLCRENDLDARLKTAVRAQTDALIRHFEPYFQPLPDEEPDPKLVGKVEQALEEPITGHRAHGHAVTFATLGLRALKELPRMATPKVVEGLCRISRRIGRIPAAPDHAYNREHPLGDYADPGAIVEATFDCLLRYEGVHFDALKRPNFTHRITYTDALVQLHGMGHGELAARGHASHGIYVNTAPPAGTKRGRRPHPQANLETLFSPAFWEDEDHARAWRVKFDAEKNRMGEWIVGHLFKVLYSYLRLRKRVKDEEKARRVDAIVLERYVDPTAKGG